MSLADKSLHEAFFEKIERWRWVMPKDKIIDTTLGDLIVALTDETDRLVGNKADTNIIVAYILSDLLNQSEPLSRYWH
jgi:hypothetical protein